MEKYTVDLDKVLNDFEYSEYSSDFSKSTRDPIRRQDEECSYNGFFPNKVTNNTKHSVTNVLQSLNEYLNTEIGSSKVEDGVNQDCNDQNSDLNATNLHYIEQCDDTFSLSNVQVLEDTTQIDKTDLDFFCTNRNVADVNNTTDQQIGYVGVLPPNISRDIKIEENSGNTESLEIFNSQYFEDDGSDGEQKTGDMSSSNHFSRNQFFEWNEKEDSHSFKHLKEAPIEAYFHTSESEVNSEKIENVNDLIRRERSLSDDICEKKSSDAKVFETESAIVENTEKVSNTETGTYRKVGFNNNVEIDEDKLDEYFNELEKELGHHPENNPDSEIVKNSIEDIEIPKTDLNSGVVKAAMHLEVDNQKGVNDSKNNQEKEEESSSIQKPESILTAAAAATTTTTEQTERPYSLNVQSVEQREIDLIGEPGSTPYNNVYINQELPEQLTIDTSAETVSCSSTDSSSPQYDDEILQIESEHLYTLNTLVTRTDRTNGGEQTNETFTEHLLENNSNFSESNAENHSLTEEASRGLLGKQAPLWIPDTDAISCLHCDMKFTVIKRRHHCRACGLVLCSKCCHTKHKLEYLGIEARICNKCYDILNDSSSRSGYDILSQACGPLPPRSLGQPNPNNPLEYCSTIPPFEQVATTATALPSVMVPVGVLKRTGSSKNKSTKSVIFCDGIRPGSDLTNLDRDLSCNDNKQLIRANKENNNLQSKQKDVIMEIDTRSFIPSVSNKLPPIVSPFKSDIKYTEIEQNSELISKLKNEVLTFAIHPNLYVHVKIINLSCCINKVVWCFSTEGLISVGQDEIVILLEFLENETSIPKDIFLHLNNIYYDAVKGNTINEMGISLHNNSIFLENKFHAGFIYIRPTFQCTQNVIIPKESYLIGILIHRWETPWAKLFPLRLILRLGAEYRYYPSPIVSIRERDSVFVEIGNTIINILADFRNFSYTIPNIKGVTILMEDVKTILNFPINTYDQVMKSMNNSSDHIIAFSGNFSLEADSHLVCIQDKNTNAYSTHAINIHNKPRKLTGATFIVFNGALKSSSGLTGKLSIVEDGLMIQMLSEQMQQMRDSLRNMKNYTICCGKMNESCNETVEIIWAEPDRVFNLGITSPIDNLSMAGIPSIRVHNGKDYTCSSGNRLIRWTEAFILEGANEIGRGQGTVDISVISESIAKSTCHALMNYLDLLTTNNFHKVGVRATIHVENVSYLAGSNNVKLPPIYMNSLDNELIPTLQNIISNHPTENAIVLELIFRILKI